MGGLLSVIANSSSGTVVSSSVILSTVGTYTWQVPAGVTSISVVAVGGGGGGFNPICACGALGNGAGGALAYANNISVTPLQTINYTVGISGSGASGLSGGTSTFGTYVSAGGGVTAVSGTGGAGTVLIGTGFAGGNAISGSTGSGGAGGAGGYNGVGAQGNAVAVTGSGAGSGGWDTMSSTEVGGGGVGLFGNTGTGTTKGSGGSGGGSGGSVTAPHGGNYGGGGSTTTAMHTIGGQGAIRIVWPGTTRQFPSTNVSTV